MASLKEALLKGLAPDGGLYMPQTIRLYPPAFYKNMAGMSLREISFVVAEAFWNDDIPADLLQEIIYDSINFDMPLVKIADNRYLIELFHGPSYSFKDVGMRLMARLLGYFGGKTAQKTVNVFATTTGDTGAAMAEAFAGVPGVRAYILYPRGKASAIQEKQMALQSGNIVPFEIDGTFEDCQRLIRQIFGDKELNRNILITSANSVNVARLLPQSFYYFYAYANLLKIVEKPTDVVCSVPCGNFGSLTAGLIAKRMGLPIKRFVAATNRNDVFERYLRTGSYEPRPSVPTIASSMDVGAPFNIERIRELYADGHDRLRNDVESVSYDDEQICETMRRVYAEANYMLDPHGAVAYRALDEKLRPGEIGISLAPAHPAKYAESVSRVLGAEVPVPTRLVAMQQYRKRSIPMSPLFADLKKFLLQEM